MYFLFQVSSQLSRLMRLDHKASDGVSKRLFYFTLRSNFNDTKNNFTRREQLSLIVAQSGRARISRISRISYDTGRN